jgi:hypothetical protein
VVGFEKNAFLQLGRLNLVVLNDYVFPERFHCEHFAGIFLLNQKHFAESATTDDFRNLEVA